MNGRQNIGMLIIFYFTKIYLFKVKIKNIRANLSLVIDNNHKMKAKREEAQCILKFSV